jgi:hypothetical protein
MRRFRVNVCGNDDGCSRVLIGQGINCADAEGVQKPDALDA